MANNSVVNALINSYMPQPGDEDLMPPTAGYQTPERDINSILSIAGARLSDRLSDAGASIAQALMAPGNAVMGQYDQRPVYADGSVGMFDPRMVEDAATLAGSVSLGAAPMPRPTNSLGSGGSTVNRLLEDVRRRRSERAEMVQSIMSSNPSSVRLSGPSGPVLVGPDMSKPGGSRVTYFGEDGIPNGHSEFASLEKALEQALLDGYRPQ